MTVIKSFFNVLFLGYIIFIKIKKIRNKNLFKIEMDLEMNSFCIVCAQRGHETNVPDSCVCLLALQNLPRCLNMYAKELGATTEGRAGDIHAGGICVNCWKKLFDSSCPTYPVCPICKKKFREKRICVPRQLFPSLENDIISLVHMMDPILFARMCSYFWNIAQKIDQTISIDERIAPQRFFSANLKIYNDAADYEPKCIVNVSIFDLIEFACKLIWGEINWPDTEYPDCTNTWVNDYDFQNLFIKGDGIEERMKNISTRLSLVEWGMVYGISRADFSDYQDDWADFYFQLD